MVGNFKIADIITIVVIGLLLISVVVTIIIALSKNNKNESVLDKPENKKDKPAALDSIMELQPLENQQQSKVIEVAQEEQIKPQAEQPRGARPELSQISQQPIQQSKPQAVQPRPKPTLAELEQKMAGRPVERRTEQPNIMASALQAMKKDLEEKGQDTVTHFEQEQEEKAIISYQELMQKKVQNIQPQAEQQKPRPTYDEHELERTLNMEPISQEIKKNDEFLKALKEFRKNL